MRTLEDVIKALTICKNPDINRNCKDCPMPDTQECMGILMTDALHYLETWKIIVESERKAHKADAPANPPLTWNELCRIDMIGEPVWNSGTKRWMLLIDSGFFNNWIELVNHDGGQEYWIEHDLRLAPLYRKPVVERVQSHEGTVPGEDHDAG